MEQLPIPEPPGFSRLSKTEQIHYLQALWDRIAKRPAEVPVPDEHLKIAERRLSAYRRNPRRVRPAHGILDRLAKKGR
jgi:putative addiction module component (TIGR02574 family)